VNGYEYAKDVLAEHGWRAPRSRVACPVSNHGKGRGDRSKSLSVQDTGEKLLFHCFTGCPLEEILRALGLTVSDIFAEEPDRISEHTESPASIDGALSALQPQGLEQQHVTFRTRTSTELVEQLAKQLGVPVLALQALELGIATGSDLRDLGAWGAGWAEYPDWVYSFPERDASGAVVGFSFRTVDGKKGSPSNASSCRRGLIYDPRESFRDKTVLVLEGASCTAACLAMGLTVVGRFNNQGGADDLAKLLTDAREIFILGENDRAETGRWPGREGAITVASSMEGILKRPIRLALPPGNAKDLRAWSNESMKKGAALDDPEFWRTRGEDLLAHIESNSFETSPTPSVGFVSASTEGLPNSQGASVGFVSTTTEGLPPSRETSVGFVSATTGESPRFNGDPEELPPLLPPALPFDPESLPSRFADRVMDVAERMQCPADFPAVSLLIMLAGLLGRRVGIRPKRNDDWLVIANLWGVLIGPPSIMKSPPLHEMLRPLRELDDEASEDYAKACLEHGRSMTIAKVRRLALEKKLTKAIENNKRDEAASIERELQSDPPEAPKRKRYFVNDSTVEKLGEIQRDNPTGIIMVRDEFAGFMRGLERDGQENARAYFLEGFEGSGFSYTDRISRGTTKSPNTISMIGTIQPNPFDRLVRAYLRDGGADDGFIQRLQVAVFPDAPTDWRQVDRLPDKSAMEAVQQAARRIASLKPIEIGAIPDSSDSSKIPFLHFEDSAQNLFDAWYGALQLRLRRGDEPPSLQAHLAKYASLIPSIALVLHIADDGVGAVAFSKLEMALRWSAYLESHARRIYAVAADLSVAPAHAIASKILNGKLQDPIVKRDIVRKRWAGLADTGLVEKGLELLVDLNWLDIEWLKETDGRPAMRHRVHPKILARVPRTADKTDKSPDHATPADLSEQDHPSHRADKTDKSLGQDPKEQPNSLARTDHPSRSADKTDKSPDPENWPSSSDEYLADPETDPGPTDDAAGGDP